MPPPLPPWTPAYATTRDALQRVAVHVLARRRFALSGRFGLRATPRGFGAPAAGPDAEVVRVAGTLLIRERTGSVARTESLDLRGATLADAARFAGVTLDDEFRVGRDTVPVGDPHAPLAVDPDAAGAVAAWFGFGSALLDAVVAELGPAAEPSVAQLWPEHFDVGIDLAAAPGRRVNLGASAGDRFLDGPYLYVGPWDADRPGDPGYWNQPFGAALASADLRARPDPWEHGREFLRRGVALLGEGGAGDAPQPNV